VANPSIERIEVALRFQAARDCRCSTDSANACSKKCLGQIKNFPDDHYLTTLVVTGTVVLLMVYVVMPRYTKLIRRWVFA